MGENWIKKIVNTYFVSNSRLSADPCFVKAWAADKERADVGVPFMLVTFDPALTPALFALPLLVTLK